MNHNTSDVNIYFSTVCKKESYKSNISNDKCTPCPSGSTSNQTRTACDCLPAKHRLKTETGVSSARCYGKNFSLIIVASCMTNYVVRYNWNNFNIMYSNTINAFGKYVVESYMLLE